MEFNMDIQERLSVEVSKYNILNHPFYKAWSAGELPEAMLSSYAEEYGAFIRLMPVGWNTLNDLETVKEENEHSILWDKFAEALGTKVGEAKIIEIQNLINLSNHLFSIPELAMGALYAFEIQQPETATSKLDGLNEFYNLSKSANEYFIEHTKNHHEAKKLINLMSTLSELDQIKAIDACKTMSKAIWDGLTGIFQNNINN